MGDGGGWGYDYPRDVWGMIIPWHKVREVRKGRLFKGVDYFKYLHQRGRSFEGGDHSRGAINRGMAMII